jgi:hypothetical protein
LEPFEDQGSSGKLELHFLNRELFRTRFFPVDIAEYRKALEVSGVQFGACPQQLKPGTICLAVTDGCEAAMLASGMADRVFYERADATLLAELQNAET